MSKDSMNIGLTGKLFGGPIAEVMDGCVAKDEHQMLARVMAQYPTWRVSTRRD